VGAVDPHAVHAGDQHLAHQPGVSGGLGRHRDHDPRWPAARDRAEQRRRPDRQHITTASKADRLRARQGFHRTAGDRAQRIEHGINARLDVPLAAAQRGQPERGQPILEVTQVVPAQCQVLQEVAGARVTVGITSLDPRTPAVRRFTQPLADRRQLLDQRRQIMTAQGTTGR
jgi:hypothetical protein